MNYYIEIKAKLIFFKKNVRNYKSGRLLHFNLVNSSSNNL
jgi:hypothetical protein